MNKLKRILIYYFKISLNIFIILVVDIFLFNIAHAKKNYELNKLVIFGDSLSDVGNYKLVLDAFKPSRMIAGDNKLYVEYITKIFTGKNIYPSDFNGTNYSYTNALVEPIGNSYIASKSVYKIFNQYIHSQKIDSNNLYIIWGGANDIPPKIITKFIPSYIINTIYSKIKFTRKLFSLKKEHLFLEDYTKKTII